MPRHTRYQALILEDHHVLLIRHVEHATGRGYWVIPGGGQEPEESEEACVIREAKEETNLIVEVERLLLDGPERPGGAYQWLKTYLCRPVGGQAAPGYEPEVEAAANYSISEVRWFDLRSEGRWGSDLIGDPFTYPQLVRARQELGYED